MIASKVRWIQVRANEVSGRLGNIFQITSMPKRIAIRTPWMTRGPAVCVRARHMLQEWSGSDPPDGSQVKWAGAKTQTKRRCTCMLFGRLTATHSNAATRHQPQKHCDRSSRTLAALFSATTLKGGGLKR